MKFKKVIAALIISQFAISDDELSSIPGAFVDVGYSAKSISMGMVQTNLNEGALSAIFNPSNLANEKNKHSIYLNNFKLRNLDNYLVLAYSTNSIQNIPMGILLITNGDELWSESQIGVSIGYSFTETFGIGLTSKIYTVSAGNNKDGEIQDLQVSGDGFGFGFDSGLQYKLSETQKFALVFKNLFSSVSYNSSGGGGLAEGSYNENIPSHYVFGYSVKNKSVSLFLDILNGYKNDSPKEVRIGSEWNIFRNIINLRGGYRSELMTGENKMYGFGTGIQYGFKNIELILNLGYFFRPIEENMNEMRIEIGFNVK